MFTIFYTHICQNDRTKSDFSAESRDDRNTFYVSGGSLLTQVDLGLFVGSKTRLFTCKYPKSLRVSSACFVLSNF